MDIAALGDRTGRYLRGLTDPFDPVLSVDMSLFSYEEIREDRSAALSVFAGLQLFCGDNE